MPNKERQGKWQPFDALTGFQASLRKVEEEKDKVSKPIIYPDKLEEMNEILTSAYNEKEVVIINFYRGGYIYEITGLIEKLDPINKAIRIGNSNIKVNMIVDIKKG